MPTQNRSIHHLTKNMIALILAGGRGARLMNMTDWRAKPAVPFGGKFRIIDFPLSNCVNSGIRKICIMTQYKADSLIRHIQQGWWLRANSSIEKVTFLTCQGGCRPKAILNNVSLFMVILSHYPLRFT